MFGTRIPIGLVVRLTLLCLLCLMSLPGAASATTVSVDNGTLRVSGGPGEWNAITVAPEGLPGFVPVLAVTDGGAAPIPGPGCLPSLTPDRVTCNSAGIGRIEMDLGDGDDSALVLAPLPSRLLGGEGNDELTGNVAPDTLDGGNGSDYADAGAGDDFVLMRDKRLDSVTCGGGRDAVRAEVLDTLEFSCERVDYGPPGRVGRLRLKVGGGRFVPIPGQGGARIDRRLLPSILYMIRRYKIRIGDGYSLGGNHTPKGEHPLGLAVDIYPGAGGSWRKVTRLARWAEPRQNRPRPPFRWVGYRGDYNHGPGNHLHLSWQHSPGRRGRPVRKVWVFAVGRGAAPAMAPRAGATNFPRATGAPDRF
jgi:Ca2+-binding RTX toxin-like protein